MTKGRVAITGGAGQLGRPLTARFKDEGWEVMASTHGELDISDREALHRIAAWRPQVVINAAAWTDVDGCARDPARAKLINGDAAGWVAEAAAEVGALVVQVSTNEVFDGSRDSPYAEDDDPNPINPYGASKLRGEQAVVAANPRHLIVRTAWIFGPGGRNFPSKILEIARRRAAGGEALRVVVDEIGNPTWAPDLARAIHDIVRAMLHGTRNPSILHVAGEPATSRFVWAQATLAGLPEVKLLRITAAEYPRPSRVPLRAVLATGRARALGIAPSDWRFATASYAAELLATVSA